MLCSWLWLCFKISHLVLADLLQDVTLWYSRKCSWSLFHVGVWWTDLVRQCSQIWGLSPLHCIKNSIDVLIILWFCCFLAFHLVLCVLFRFCLWSIWMWRTAAVPRSRRLNSPTPALAVSLLHFLQRRNHSVQSSRSSSKDHTFCSLPCALPNLRKWYYIIIIINCPVYKRRLTFKCLKGSCSL